MALDITTWKKDFFEKEKGKETPEMVAQRLINIYHQLSVLGESSVPAFNKMLLDCTTPAVLIALKGLPGGEEVREYAEFVQNQEDHVAQEDEQQDEAEKPQKVLPTAEEVSPLWDMISPAYSGKEGGGLSDAQVFTLSTRLNNSALSLLEAEYKKILSKIIQNNRELMEIVSYLVIDSDIDKTQKNLKATLDRMSEAEQSQIREMTKMLMQSGQVLSEKNKKTITSILQENLLTGETSKEDTSLQPMKGEKNG